MTTELADALRSAREGDFTKLIDAIPYFAFLGVEMTSRDGRRVAVMRFSEHLVGNPTVPALHGGTLGALLESVALLECLATTESTALPKTITLTIDYLRPGKTQDVFAEARVVKAGRRVMVLRCSAWQENEDAPIATATVHLKVSTAS